MASGSTKRIVLGSRRKADIWNDFDEIIVDNRKVGECKRCGHRLIASSNSTLRRHLEACKKKEIPERSELNAVNSEHQPWVFDQMRARLAGMQMVIREVLPFDLLERQNVVNWIRVCLQPQYEKVSRTTLKRDAISNWKLVKNDMIAFFENFSGRVALTCDMWSSPHNLPDTYICITCHYIDDLNWKMVKRTITFESLPHPHSGERIHQVVFSTINEFKMTNKIITLSFDNATNNDNAVGRLKYDLDGPCNNIFLHTRCVCHILNLAVQVLLEKYKSVLDKFRRMNSFIFRNGKRMSQLYAEHCRREGVKRLKGEMDMPVRWNSTYKMIKRLLKQKDVLTSFYEIQNGGTIHERDWNVIIDLVDILEVFYIASTKLSGVYYPTSPIVLPQIVLICEKLAEYRGKQVYKTNIEFVLDKLFKYFKVFPPIFTVAAALNPIFNKRQVCNFLELIEDYVTTEYFSSEENIKIFEDSFADLFRYYKNVNMATRPTQPLQVGGSSRSSGKSILDKQSSKRAKSSSSTNPVDELSVYCANLFTLGDDDYEKFDILDWWFNRRNDYPLLAIMARDVLTVQASTVASESCFSTSGRVISERRASLTTESVELCICLKDYLDSIDRVQDKTSLEDSALDGLEEDLAFGSEQTSYTSSTDDQSNNPGSSDVYTPQMQPEMFQTYQQQFFQPSNQFQEQQFFPPSNQFQQQVFQPPILPHQLFPSAQQQQQFHDFQPFQQFPNFYNTEDQRVTQQQFDAYRLRDINEHEDDDNEENEENEDEEVSENDDE